MGSVREDVAGISAKKHGETKPCRVCNAIAAETVALVCKRIEGVENPYPITRYNDLRYLDKPVHDAFEKARQAILDVIKEE